ncbi:MAG: hypothetical protein KGS47_06025 [Chloroflexi bacterium]|nr:hypothetical protein [Chloroflexota bacterium]
MMPRWYRAYEAHGRLKLKLDQLRGLIERQRMGDVVPVLRVERAPGNQYYLFLGIEHETIGEMPEWVRDVLDRANFLGRPIDKPFTLDEIRSMVGSEVVVHDYMRLLPFHRTDRPPIAAADGAAELDEGHPQAIDESDRCQTFVQLLSALGSGSIATLQRIWHELGGGPGRSLTRMLRLLGYLETDRTGRHWAMAPTVFVPIAHGPHAGAVLLCGRRDQRLVAALAAAFQVEHVMQPHGVGPAACIIHDATPAALVRTAAEQRVTARAMDDLGARLARALPDLGGWVERLEHIPGVHPGRFSVARYDGREFAPVAFSSGQSGLYDLRTRHSRGEPTAQDRAVEYTLLYHAPTGRWLRGDWHGMRYAAIDWAGIACPIQYDPATGWLRVDAQRRWPELYERALVLATGRLPTWRNDGWEYEGIDPQLIATLTPKLNLVREE